MVTITRVYEVINGNRRLLNTIDFSSRFHNVELHEGEVMGDPKVQARVANEICDGWRYNGNSPDAKYVYEQSGF